MMLVFEIPGTPALPLEEELPELELPPEEPEEPLDDEPVPLGAEVTVPVPAPPASAIRVLQDPVGETGF